MNYVSIFVLSISINCAGFSTPGISSAASGPAGTWTGESICTVKNSSGRDEDVLYRATQPGAKGKFQIKADKVVNGQPEDMGALMMKRLPRSSAR